MTRQPDRPADRPRHPRRRPARRARAGRRRGLAPATPAAGSADVARSGRCSRHGPAPGLARPAGRAGRGRRPGHGPRRLRRRLADVAAIERSDRRSVADRGRRLADPRDRLTGHVTVAGSGGIASARPPGQRRPARSFAGDGPIRRDVRLVDLSTGTLGPASVGTYAGPQTMLPRPSGGWACICTDWTASSGGSGLVVTFEPVAADGTRGTPVTLRTVRGESDPSLSPSDQPQLVDVAVSGSPDGRYAFVGWSARHGANGWTAGVDIVDLGSGAVVGSIPLAVGQPSGAANRTAIRVAPKVSLSPSSDEALVSSFWYVDSPSATPPSGTDHWISTFSAGKLGALSAAGSTAGEACGEADSGPIDASTLLRHVRDAGWSARGRAASDRRVAHRHDRRPGHELGPPGIVARPSAG